MQRNAPSFLLVMPDDFPRTFIGASHGLTPTLDRLATEGVTFESTVTAGKMPKDFKPEEHFDEYERIFRRPYFKTMPDGSKRHETELIADRGI